MAYNAALMEATSQEIMRTEVRPQFQRSDMEFNEFLSKSASSTNVRGYQVPAYVQAEESNAWHAEGGDLPASGSDVDVKMTAVIARYAKAIEWTGDVAAFDKPGSKALVKIKDRLTRVMKNIRVEFSQLFYGDGSGAKGAVASTPAGGATTVTLATTFAASQFLHSGADQIGKGRRVQFCSPDGTTLRETGKVFTVTAKTGSTITFTPGLNAVSTDVVANDIIVDQGAAGLAFDGLQTHIVKTTLTDYQGKSRVTYPMLASRKYDASGAPLTFGLANYMEEASVFRLDEVESVSAECTIVTSATQYSKARQMGANLVQYQGGQTELTLGFDKVKTALGGLWRQRRWCPEANVYFIHKPSYIKVEAMPLDYIDNGNGGNRLLKPSSTAAGGFADAQIGFIGWKGQLVGLEPRNSAAMVDLELSGIRAHQNGDYV